MGVFLVGSLIWMAAILLDENGVFPRWFGYLNLCNALTEVVIAPSWIFQRGVLAWNGVIALWIDVVVFGLYTGVFIYLLREPHPARRPRRPGPCRRSPPDARRAVPPARRGRSRCMTTTEAATTGPTAEATRSSNASPVNRTCGSSSCSSRSSSPRTSASTSTSAPRTSAAFLEAQSALTLPLGILDTIVLLTSSWAIARCAQHARAGQLPRPPSGRAFATVGLGAASSRSRWSSGCT